MSTTTRRSRIAWAAVLLLTPTVAQGADALPIPVATFSFAPNQLAGSAWYKPGNPPRLINGHLDDSFGQKELWPNLVKTLRQTRGAFGVYAAEIGHLAADKGLLSLLKSEGVAVSVEVPGFTQPIDGAQLGRVEIHGEAANGTNLFANIFRICEPKDRTAPLGSGWFVARDGTPFVPDELIFDERMPNLLPEFDPTRLALAQGSWEQRKQAARRLSPFMVSRLPYDRLIATLMQDYVGYLRVAKDRWGERMPAVSLHWNVNPGWEWRDEKGLDAVHAKHPALFDTAENFDRIVFTSPQYNSVSYLNQLVDLLSSSGFPPRTVYMDIDWTYDIPYIVEVLKRHKVALRQRGIQMGINVVEASIGEQEELFYDADTLKKRADSRAAPNILYEKTLIAIMRFLKGRGVYEKGMHIRVGSWSHRPHEVGVQVNENTPGSLAHTANEIVKLLQID